MRSYAHHSDSHACKLTPNGQYLSSPQPAYLQRDYHSSDESADQLLSEGEKDSQILLEVPNPQILHIHHDNSISLANCEVEQMRIPVALRLPYPHLEDLLAIDGCRPPPTHVVPEWLAQIVTPLKPLAWAAALASHPDEAFRDYICRGISQGFRVGFDLGVVCESAERNMPSTQAHQEPVEEFLWQECEARRSVGPMPKSHLRPVQVNRIGVIPKSTPGKWRIIVVFSAPEGRSVNSGIPSEWCHLERASVDDAVHHILRMGRHSLLAKVDIARAYRNVPVHPQDRWLLGIVWNNHWFQYKWPSEWVC